MLRVFRREKIQIALHRVRNFFRMHGRKNDVSSFRSLEGRERRLVVADLTNENDIWRLTKRDPQSSCQTTRFTTDLTLCEMTPIAGELILDGILDRHYMSHQVLVHPLKNRRDGSGFS